VEQQNQKVQQQQKPTTKKTVTGKIQVQQEQQVDDGNENVGSGSPSGSGKSPFNFQIKRPTKPSSTDPVNHVNPAAPLDPVTDVQGHEDQGFEELIQGLDLNQLGAVEEVLKQVLSEMDVDVDILEQTLQNLRIDSIDEEEEHTDDEKDKLN